MKIERAYIGTPTSLFTKLFVPRLLELGPCAIVLILQREKAILPTRSTWFLRYMQFIKSHSLQSWAGSWYWKWFAQQNKIPIYCFQSVNDENLIDILSDMNFILSAGIQEKVGRKLLEACPNGIVNFHYSLLPKYRGCFPIFWQLLEKDLEFGYTFHQMNDYWDMGSIILQNQVELPQKILHTTNPVASISDLLTVHASNQISKLVLSSKKVEQSNEISKLYTRKMFYDFIQINTKDSGQVWYTKCQASRLLILNQQYRVHIHYVETPHHKKNQLLIRGKNLIIWKDQRKFIIHSINYLPPILYYIQFKHFV